jgi:hypothetical protein
MIILMIARSIAFSQLIHYPAVIRFPRAETSEAKCVPRGQIRLIARQLIVLFEFIMDGTREVLKRRPSLLPKYRQIDFIPASGRGVPDAQLVHFRLQRGAFKPQNPSSAGRARNSPVAFYQYIFNVPA